MTTQISPPATPKPETDSFADPSVKFERPAHVFNREETPLFGVLTDLFSQLRTKKPKERREALAKWFNTWRAQIGNDLYPAIRLMVPQCDKDRAVYGLKEQGLAKIFTEVLGLDPKSSAALKLKNWKKPTNDAEQKGAGDFGSVLYACIQSRVTITKSTLRIDEVNTLLDALAANTRNVSQVQVMRQICSRCRAEDQVWIVRIILKDLKISVKENTVFSVFHPSAYEIFNSTSDLKQVCWKLYDPYCQMDDEDKEIQLFQPFQPMLCKRPRRELQDVVKLMGKKEFIMEEKLDGERMQLHKRGKEYYYCSRKGKDYTYLYGQHVGTGSLTPFIDAAFDPRVSNVILDGEMLVWDPVTEHYLPFGWLKPAALDKSDDKTKMHPCFKVFDVLYLRDARVYKWPLHKRKEALEKVFTPIPGILEFAYQARGSTTQDVRRELERIMDDRGEGLVIKNPKSIYVLNGREDAWLKVKPEYIDEMADTVDVLVIGANWGTGRRGGGVSTLICGVRDDSVSSGDPVFLSFVRIGSGLSMYDFDEIRQKKWEPYHKGETPDFMKLSEKGTEDKPDVYIRPEDSFIVTVKAAEIVTSEKYAMDWTMRFPRCRTLRRDVDWKDCMTAKEIHELRTGGRKRKTGDELAPVKKRKGNNKLVLPTSFVGTSVKGLKVKSDLFKDLKFFILEGTDAHDKGTLEKMVHEHGGKFQQLFKDDDLIVISGRLGFPKANAAIKKGFDVLSPSYILECIKKGRVLPKDDKYLTINQPEVDEDEPMEEEFRPAESQNDEGNEWLLPSSTGDGDADEEDDSPESDPDSDPRDQIDDTNDDSDTDIVKDRPPLDDSVVGGVSQLHMGVSDGSEDKEAPPEEDVQMGEDEEASQYDSEKIFRHLCFYLDTPDNAAKHGLKAPSQPKESIVNKFESLDKLIRENGGKVTSNIHDPKLTHIVIDKRDKSRTSQLRTLSQVGTKYRQQVTSDFVTDSVDDEALVSESVYRP